MPRQLLSRHYAVVIFALDQVLIRYMCFEVLESIVGYKLHRTKGPHGEMACHLWFVTLFQVDIFDEILLKNKGREEKKNFFLYISFVSDFEQRAGFK